MYNKGFAEILEEIASENSDLHSENAVDSSLRSQILSGWESAIEPRHLSYLLGQQTVLQRRATVFSNDRHTPEMHPYIKYRKFPRPTSAHTQSVNAESYTKSVMPGVAASLREPHNLNATEQKAYETITECAQASNLLPRGFTAIELKKTYLAAAKRVHPDRGGSHERFLETKASYEILVAFLKGLE